MDLGVDRVIKPEKACMEGTRPSPFGALQMASMQAREKAPEPFAVVIGILFSAPARIPEAGPYPVSSPR
jgi:hypothetical protein